MQIWEKDVKEADMGKEIKCRYGRTKQKIIVAIGRNNSLSADMGKEIKYRYKAHVHVCFLELVRCAACPWPVKTPRLAHKTPTPVPQGGPLKLRAMPELRPIKLTSSSKLRPIKLPHLPAAWPIKLSVVSIRSFGP